jgi:hypothetical protein
MLSGDIQIFLFHSAEDCNIRSTRLGENNYSKCIILSVVIWQYLICAAAEGACTVDWRRPELFFFLFLLIFLLQKAVCAHGRKSGKYITQNTMPQPSHDTIISPCWDGPSGCCHTCRVDLCVLLAVALDS